MRNKERMFELEEPSEVLFDTSKRSFYVNEIVQVRLKNETEMEIASYAAQEIRDLTVWIKLTGYDEFFSVIRFDKIPAFFRFSYTIPLTEEAGYYLTESGKEVEVPRIPLISEDSVSFKVSSDDPFYQKLTKIKAKWRITFGDYGTGENPGNWLVMKPVHAREWVVLVTNMAFLCSTTLFEERLVNMEGLYDNNKNVYTREDREKILEKILNKSHLNLGVVTGYAGLGGGAALGLSEFRLIAHYMTYDYTSTFFHELAHCLGYSHDSNMIYPGEDGVVFAYAFLHLHDFLTDRKLLPYPDYRLLNTYELHKAELHNQEKPRPDYEYEKEASYEKMYPIGQEPELFSE